MRSLLRWDPFNDLISLQDAMNRLFEAGFAQPAGMGLPGWGEERLPVDVYEAEGEVVIRASVPGARPEDIDVTVTGNTLVIQGDIRPAEDVDRESYICQECYYGRVSRSMILPANLDTSSADASFENGVLLLRIRKARQAPPKAIRVKTIG